MQASVLPIIAILTTVTVSQKYKKIPITTKGGAKFQELIPGYGNIIFEMKTCAHLMNITLLKQLSHKNGAVYKIMPNKNGKILFFKFPNYDEFVARNNYPFTVDCGKFYKFRLSWTQGLALSVVTPTSWQTFLTWQDPAPYTGVFKWVYLYGPNTDWIIYKIEHTTSPFRVTCTNFG